MAEELDDHGDHLCVLVFDQVFAVILDSGGHFISGGDRKGNAEPMRPQAHAQHSSQRPGLGNDGQTIPLFQQLRHGCDERQGNAIEVVDHAQAIWAFKNHVVLASDLREFFLLGAPVRTTLRKSGRKDDGR